MFDNERGEGEVKPTYKKLHEMAEAYAFKNVVEDNNFFNKQEASSYSYQAGFQAALSIPEVKAAFEALESCEVNGAGFTNMRVKQALEGLKEAGLSHGKN